MLKCTEIPVPAVWDSVDGLKKHYSQIAMIRSILDNIFVEDDKSSYRLTFSMYPKPDGKHKRTLDNIYLELHSGVIKCLWTPFGEVKLMEGGAYEPNKKLSDNFIEQIGVIYDVKDVVISEIILELRKDVALKIDCKYGKIYDTITFYHLRDKSDAPNETHELFSTIVLAQYNRKGFDDYIFDSSNKNIR